MGKINGCLKRVFISFNAVFLGFGCMMVMGAMKATAYSNEVSAVGGPSLAWVWVFVIGLVSISSLGIYAGYSEKPIALKTFAGFMGIGMAIMLIFGIIVVDTRNKIRHGFLDSPSEVQNHFTAEKEKMELLEEMQKSFHCCGVVSAEAWGNNIPYSCECSLGYECQSKPQGASGPDQIYQQTCGKFLYASVSPIFEMAIGFFFVFAVIAFLGLLISLLMIHQVKLGGGSTAMNHY